MKGDGIHQENMSSYSLTPPIYPSDAWMDTYRQRFWSWRLTDDF